MMRKVLVANRGEVAVRIARAAADLGIDSLAIYAEEDANSLHREVADASIPLDKAGPAAYLDADRILAIARETGCDALHPGYGFLSENANFARACAEAGVNFMGPAPDVLEVFGDKGKARALAVSQSVPVAEGTQGPTSLAEATHFMERLGGAVMLKAVAGGGGRGMRAVLLIEHLPSAFERCSSEALLAFGNGDLYIEQLIRGARHIEVQVVGDGTGAVRDLYERDCTLQRRHQKLIEFAPSPFLPDNLRHRIIADACRLVGAVKYRGLGTVEFLVDSETGKYIFIECNPRLQVEHTVTEEVTGLDLVALQFALADGARLVDLPLPLTEHEPIGFSVQARVNMESMQRDAQAFPTGGTLKLFELPSGPRVRVDTFGYTGYKTTGSFDSLLAKVVVSGRGDFSAVCEKAARAVSAFRVAGVETNIDYLVALLRDPNVANGLIDTTYVERNAPELYEKAAAVPKERLLHNRDGFDTFSNDQADSPREEEVPSGALAVRAPMQGRVISIEKDATCLLRPGEVVAVLEAMKLEHSISSEVSGTFVGVSLVEGQVVSAGTLLGWIVPDVSSTENVQTIIEADPDHIRPDLADLLSRKSTLLDSLRPDAVAKRHRLRKNTARENVDLLLDDGSFVEYGGLTLAMQRGRRTEEELISMSPADGVVTGLGLINGDRFDTDKARCAVMAYDYTVFAGTQGFMAHRKMDRIVEVCERTGVSFVLFAEGGGGRPGDTDYVGVSGLEFTTFSQFAKLSGKVPMIGIASGRCFAGNAALLGCCDVIIATRDTTLGMAGPAMIEGGGLGVVRAEDVGPIGVQTRNGVVDLVAEDETEAVALAKMYLGYVQGDVEPTSVADQRLLRKMVPENRVKGYDVRRVIATLCDEGSFLELRKDFGRGMVTGFARLDGRAVGLIANDCSHLGGAIDSPSADKMARFLELCDSYGLPIVSLCDSPGFMVGPESEKDAAVRHFCRIFVTASHIKVPVLAVILRKAYGLGAMAMVGGNLLAPLATVAWPTGELGPMGFEGAVRLAYKRELDAIEDFQERERFFASKTEELYAKGKAMNAASYVEIDDVIDPAETRTWLLGALTALPRQKPGREATGISPW
ncbi:acetyl-CoA carboxylase family protein [Burkholderia ambifaria]|uniref:acetyl-CoA carboxylase family protein n=1 Tax=Burkholderia ambifaria TaxID=152480 RepID=UPI001B99E65B|nr:carboxyl transferase domain-containing protein [Burkholderia ambifaria]MBR8257222.1 carbamoyl-phosphate synthase large subunit [Burkholderia ambifaria]